MASRSRARSTSPSRSRTRPHKAQSQRHQPPGEKNFETMVASFGGMGQAMEAVIGLSGASDAQREEWVARAETLMTPEARDLPAGWPPEPPPTAEPDRSPKSEPDWDLTPSPAADSEAEPHSPSPSFSPSVAPLPPTKLLTREDAAELDGLIASLGGGERAPDLIAEVRAARAAERLVVVDGVDIDAVLTRMGGYDGALALIKTVRADGAAAAGLTLDEDGRFWLPSGERATHPDHGPMDRLPRRDDGTIDRQYYCSKRDLGALATVPPPRRQRDDGWTADVQTQFLEILADSGSVTRACQLVQRSRTSAYRLRRDPSAREFARSWDEALASTIALLAETALDRAVNGQEEKVFYKGEFVGHRVRYDNRLLMAMLRACDPLNYAPINELERWEGRRPRPQTTLAETTERLRLSETRWEQMDRAELDALTAREAAPRLEDGRAQARLASPARPVSEGQEGTPEPPALS